MPSDVIAPYLLHVSVVYVAGCNVSSCDQIAQPLRCVGVMLVVVGRHGFIPAGTSFVRHLLWVHNHVLDARKLHLAAVLGLDLHTVTKPLRAVGAQ